MRILAVTGTRADWGLLRPVLRALRRSPAIELRLAATGQHIMPDSGSDRLFAADGFAPDYCVDMGLTEEDSPEAIGIAMGRGLSGMAEVLGRDRPDLLLVLGDRYEILAAASAALLSRVPIAHIAGGDVTEGAFDDSIRHAITKMSALHFVTNPEAKARVLQMGEDPTHVFLTGSPGIDSILEIPRLPRSELLASVGLPSKVDTLFVVTFHPATLSSQSDMHCRELLIALEHFREAWIIFTGSNSDPGARQIDAMVKEWAANNDRAVFHQSLGSQRYLSALAEANAVIGNSSSGLYEAPSFGIPTVNIGDRQARRVRASTIIDCAPSSCDIVAAIKEALSRGRDPEPHNPYGDGSAAEKIAAILAAVNDTESLVRKSFKDAFK